MAHPDEPPRPLAAAAPADHRAARIVFALLAAALVVLLAGYFVLTIPAAWFGAVGPRSFDAKSLAIAVGTGGIDKDLLVIAPADASGTIIVTVTLSISAGDYRGVAWQVAGLPAGTEARMLWRSEFKPGRTFTLAIPTEADRLAPVVAARDPNWIGPLNGLALALRLPTREPVRMAGVIVDPMTLTSQLAGRLRDWTTFESWSGASINTVVGGADLQELPLPVLLGLAAAIATAGAMGLAYWRPRWVGARLPLALVSMFVVLWLVLDLRWQWNLARQVTITAGRYAGKDWREKHVVAEDGLLFQFIEKVRAKLPATPARVFMVAEAHYFRGRGAYHLYPHNVYFSPWTNVIPPASALRPGDYVVAYHRGGIQFDAARGMLRWDGGPPIAAEAIVTEPGAAMFRIR